MMGEKKKLDHSIAESLSCEKDMQGFAQKVEMTESLKRHYAQIRFELEKEIKNLTNECDFLKDELIGVKESRDSFKQKALEVASQYSSVKKDLEAQVAYLNEENKSLKAKEETKRHLERIDSLQKENEQLVQEIVYYKERQGSIESELQETLRLVGALKKEMRRLEDKESEQLEARLKAKIKEQENALEEARSHTARAQQARQQLQFSHDSMEEELLSCKKKLRNLQARQEETEEKYFEVKGKTAPLAAELKHLQALYEREKVQSGQKDKEINQLIRQANHAELELEKAKLAQEHSVSSSVGDKRKDDLIAALKQALREERQKNKEFADSAQDQPAPLQSPASHDGLMIEEDMILEDDEDNQTTGEFQVPSLESSEPEPAQDEEIAQDEAALPLKDGFRQMTIPQKERDGIGAMFEVSNEPIWKVKNDITGKVEDNLSFLDIKQRIVAREIHSETLLKKPGVNWKKVKDIFEFNTDIVSKNEFGELKLYVKRESIRMPASETVRIHSFNINAICSNISYGGCFLESPKLLEDFINIGDEVEFEFTDKGEHQGLKIKAIIRNFVCGDPSGIGLQFTPMSVESKVRLNSFFKKFVSDLKDAA